MSAIITATDFSDIATNAVHYACNMAKDLGDPLIVMHAYTVPVSFHDTPMPVIPMEESREIAEEQTNKLIEELRAQYPGIDVTGKVTYGDITDSLKDHIKEHGGWVVVVGNSSDESGFWLGSNLLTALRNLQCPVLAIPGEKTYSKVERICFACDYENVAEKLPANELVKLVTKAGAALHVLNVDHENKGFDPDTPLESTELHEMIAEAKPEYHYIDSEDIDEGIRKYVDENNMDWLVVIPHKHNFFESIFHKSHTKAIVKNSKIPIVALHDKH